MIKIIINCLFIYLLNIWINDTVKWSQKIQEPKNDITYWCTAR